MDKQALPSTEPETTKITAKIYQPMLWAFDRQVSEALLRRDAFLDRVISQEIQYVRADLKDQRNSPAAKRYISNCLNQMGIEKGSSLQTVSIVLRKTTAKDLNDLVAEHNLCRDSLINWTIALLRATKSTLDLLSLPATVDSGRYGGAEPPMSPMEWIEVGLSDPFYYVRNACEEVNECGLYSFPLPERFRGFQCVLPDEWVPTTDVGRARAFQRQTESDEFVSLMSAPTGSVPTSAQADTTRSVKSQN